MKKLIITNQKQDYLKKIDKLINCKFMSYQEFLNNYNFTYDEKTIYYLVNNYHIKGQIAKIYLDNMRYLNKDDYEQDTLNFLSNWKKELQQQNLLIVNPLFKNYLKKYEIVFMDNYPNKFWQKKIEEVKQITKVSIIASVNEKNYKHQVYELDNIEEEVIFVFNKICDLLKQGVNINHIYLTNLTDSYLPYLKKYSLIFNIPLNLKEQISIYSTALVQSFLNNYDSDITLALKEVKQLVKTINDDEIYNQIINICNRYSWCDDYNLVKDLIIDDLKETKQKSTSYINDVNEVNFLNARLTDEDYLFVVGANQNAFPKTKKDEDFLSDKLKDILGLYPVKEENQINKLKYQEQLKNIKNVIISYKLMDETGALYISNLLTDLNYKVIKTKNNSYNNSNEFNNLELAKYLDDFYKYGKVNENLDILMANYPNNAYLKYDNSYQFIDKASLKEYINDKLVLSYSSLDIYNRCNYRYYLNNILKLNLFTDTFMIYIGTIYHSILQQAFLPDFDFEHVWQQALTSNPRDFTNKEIFFLEKLKKELIFIISEINKQDTYSSYQNILTEEQINVNYGNDTFTGIIDKIKYDVDSLAVIDYKTGNPNLNLNNVIYGIGMQLPIYLYLVKHHPQFTNHHIAGFYLQKILNNEKVLKNQEDLTSQKIKDLRLQGYSNSNIEILKKFDTSYQNSQIVKSLKQAKNGFYSYSKVIDENTVELLTNMIENNIQDSFKKIRNADFNINPKRVGTNLEGCKYCTYQDICFMKEQNINNYPEYKNLEFLKEKQNG